MRQASLTEVVESSRRYDPKSPRALELNRAVVYYLAKDMQPLYTVEKPGFKKLLATLDSRYQLPSRRHFAEQELPRLYADVREKNVMPKLSKLSFFAATTDLWTSAAKHPYLSVTVHFINDEWSLETVCLDTVLLFVDHSGQNLTEAFQDVLANWNLCQDKLVCTTTDIGSNFVSAFENHLELTRLSCFGHNLDLAINKALQIDRVQQAITRCHTLVALFSRSWKKNRDLQQKQIELRLPEHTLISNVTTRWDSTYSMMARILEQQQAISAVLAEDRKNWYRMPSDREFTTLEIVSQVLRPLSVFTDALSGETQVTVSAIRPLLKHIASTLLSVSPGDCTLIKEMKETIADSLESRYIHQEVAELLDRCTFLDPRFKSNALPDSTSTIGLLKAEAKEIVKNLAAGPSSGAIEETPPPPKKSKGLGAILMKAAPDRPRKAESVTERIAREFEHFLLQPTADADALSWWRTNLHSCPILVHLARKYLCVCGTSVPSERLFSQAGYIVNHLRTHLSPEHVNMLVFLAKNMP